MTMTEPHTKNGSVDEPIGRRLKRLRLARGFSQRDLSSPGVSYAYISRIEAGARTPSVKAIRKLAEKLDVTTEYLEKGNDLTQTDLLLDELGQAADRAFRVTVAPGAIFLRAQIDGKDVRAYGPTLTDALLDVIRHVRDVQKLREAAAELEERAREIEQARP